MIGLIGAALGGLIGIVLLVLRLAHPFDDATIFGMCINELDILLVPIAVNGLGAVLAWLLAGRPKITWRYPDDVIEREEDRS